MGLTDEQCRELIEAAFAARRNAYVPYSHYRVGAALLAESGRIYQGCNVENASYGATNCGERTAIFKAVSEGERGFLAIAIVGGLEQEDGASCDSRCVSDYAYPCGICRQVMSEFMDGAAQVVVARSPQDYLVYRLDELLPNSFGDNAMV